MDDDSLAVLDSMVTTAFTLDGYTVDRTIGIVRGIIVCEETRAHAYQRMAQHAAQLGANAVIGVRYDATEIMQGVTEVLCYGTAVVVKLAH